MSDFVRFEMAFANVSDETIDDLKQVVDVMNDRMDQINRHQKADEVFIKSGHSFRVGAAIDLLNKNIPLEKIMLRGGWKSETSAMRYLQSWNDSNWLIVN